MIPSVLHLLAPSPVGGLEAVVDSLARGQRRRGAEVAVGAVVEPEARPHPFVAGLEGSGVPVEPVVVPHRAYLTEVRTLRRLIDAVDPDVVHTHGYRADVVAGTVARWNGRPTVSTVHGFTGGGSKNRLYEWLQSQSLRRFDAVVAVSRPLRSDLQSAGVDGGRIRVIPNAWRPSGELLGRDEARDRLDLPPDAPVVGWVGRLSREKGADVLLRALAGLPDGVLGAVIGDGPQMDALGELADRLGISARVRFCGRVPNAAVVYRAFDVFCLSSRTEGTPVALFEAMEAEVPVVAARVGGVPDVVTGREALLVSPEDPDALAGALREALGDREASRGRAAAARSRLRERYAPGPWVERYEELYRDVLGGREAAA